MAKDRIAPAIAAVEQKAAEPIPVAMEQFNITISSTGRPVMLAIPQDVTDGELAEFAGWVLGALLNTMRQRRAAAPKILIARGSVPAHPGSH